MYQNSIIKILLDFGLTDSEAKVYLASLNLKNITPTYLAKSTGIPRATIYDIVMGLALKGLMTVKQSDGIQKQQTLITANNPESLRNIVRERRTNLRDLESNIISIMPELKKNYFLTNQENNNTSIRCFLGYDEFIKIYYEEERDIPNEAVYAWDSFLPIDTHGSKLGNLDVSKTAKVRKKDSALHLEIIPSNERVRMAVAYQYLREPDYFKLIQHRFLPEEVFTFYNRIEIRNNNIFFFSNQREEVYGIEIKSKNLSTSLKSIFSVQWLQATPLTQEILENWVKNINPDIITTK